MRVMEQAQPLTVERSRNRQTSSSNSQRVGVSPGHSVTGDYTSVQSPYMIAPGSSAPMAFSMSLPDATWSPELADEIGWDWGDFGQLYNPSDM